MAASSWKGPRRHVGHPSSYSVELARLGGSTSKPARSSFDPLLDRQTDGDGSRRLDLVQHVAGGIGGAQSTNASRRV
jgi:hypothetical protein